MDINKTKIVDLARLGSGNGLAATSNLEAGDVIIAITNPYILVVQQTSLDKVCSQCLLKVQGLKRCVRCKVAHYCSIDCQAEAWKSMHRLECTALSKMPGVPPTAVRALMQILLTHSFGAAPDPRWKNLKTNQQQLSKTERYSGMIMQAEAACHYAKFSSPNALELAVGVLCRMSTNAIQATLASNDAAGLCFDPVMALANHSCSPNAAILFDGRRTTLRALVPIKENDEILISYIDSTQRRKSRQAKLKEAYFFTCHCEKCAKDETPYQTWMRCPRQYQNSKIDLLLNSQSLESFVRSPASTDLHVKSVIEHVPESCFDNVDRYLSVARETLDREVRLKVITQALESLRSFRDNGLYALPPYPLILHELYLYYVDNRAFPIALSLLLFMHLHCHVYTLPQLHHPSNAKRLYTIHRLSALMVPEPNEGNTLPIDDFGEIQAGFKLRQALSSIDWFNATQAFLILEGDMAPLTHGNTYGFSRENSPLLVGMEEVQKRRLDSAKDFSKLWNAQSDVKTYEAAMVFEGLRRLGGKEVAEEVMDLGLHLLR